MSVSSTLCLFGHVFTVLMLCLILFRLVHGIKTFDRRRNKPCRSTQPHNETGQQHLHSTFLLQHVWTRYFYQVCASCQTHSWALWLKLIVDIWCRWSRTESGDEGGSPGDHPVVAICQSRRCLVSWRCHGWSDAAGLLHHIWRLQDLHHTWSRRHWRHQFWQLYSAWYFSSAWNLNFSISVEAKFRKPLGSFTEPQPVCPDNLFRCNNSACVVTNHLCDYSDDCGDRSDEDDCGEISQQ